MQRNPYSPPEAKVDGGGEIKEAEPRPPLGGCLVILLVVMIIMNAWMMVIYILAALGQFRIPGLYPWVLPALLVTALVNLVSLAGIFNWFRWGVYGVLGTAALIFVSNVLLGANGFIAISGLIGPGVLLLLVKPLWKHFR